jgi:hypothetical protein
MNPIVDLVSVGEGRPCKMAIEVDSFPGLVNLRHLSASVGYRHVHPLPPKFLPDADSPLGLRLGIRFVPSKAFVLLQVSIHRLEGCNRNFFAARV